MKILWNLYNDNIDFEIYKMVFLIFEKSWVLIEE